MLRPPPRPRHFVLLALTVPLALGACIEGVAVQPDIGGPDHSIVEDGGRDTAAESAPRDGDRDNVAATEGIDPNPDEGTVSPPDGIGPPPPDGSVDTLAPDATADTLGPDSTLDTLGPDTTFDTLSPDTTFDTLLGSCPDPITVEDTPTCSKQCVDCTGDADGDGMPDGRDPEAACNDLLFSDDFRTDLDISTWLRTTGVSWSCGQVKMVSTAFATGLEFSAPRLIPAGGPYLLEMKFTFGGGAVGSSVEFRAGAAGESYTCRLVANASATLQLERNTTCGGLEIVGSSPSGPAYDDTAGQTYVLQNYGLSGKHYCRISREDGSSMQTLSADWSDCPLSTPDVFGVQTDAATITIDWIRMYRMN